MERNVRSVCDVHLFCGCVFDVMFFFPTPQGAFETTQNYSRTQVNPGLGCRRRLRRRGENVQ